MPPSPTSNHAPFLTNFSPSSSPPPFLLLKAAHLQTTMTTAISTKPTQRRASSRRSKLSAVSSDRHVRPGVGEPAGHSRAAPTLFFLLLLVLPVPVPRLASARQARNPSAL
ncbi:unnamed protein product [Prorocentrum cordatum]|uniref:Uncharacterized protein n=1 Tax=Prorocentrum cordatum TaxID=2364126 RepID=A0ABN9R607_9DINO|nr:unnamed protein product [Polarella glacialis]